MVIIFITNNNNIILKCESSWQSDQSQRTATSTHIISTADSEGMYTLCIEMYTLKMKKEKNWKYKEQIIIPVPRKYSALTAHKQN